LLTAELVSLPESISYLTHLRQLDVSEVDPPHKIPHQIADLALWPQLTPMDFFPAGLNAKFCVDPQLLRWAIDIWT